MNSDIDKELPVNELQLELLIDRKEIEKKILFFAKQLEQDYEGKEIVLVMIMKGSFILVADLIRHLHTPLHIEFLQCKSYGQGGMYKGELEVSLIDTLDIENKDVLLVDDIFDTGITLTEVINALEGKNPASLRTLVLLTKNVPRKSDYLPDYSLFDIEDHFVVGYGIDYKEYYRELPDIYKLSE